MNPVSYSIVAQVGIISINNAPLNLLSHALRQAILTVVTQAQNDASKVLVIICEGRTFCAGADIKEFNQTPQLPSLPELIAAIEASEKPVVAALHGTALGGGLELALSCHYRVALSSAKVGLPEVKLGLLPGASGTQRTPRLMGAKAALDLMTSGTPITAAKALATGLLDELVDEAQADDLLAVALAYAQKLIAQQAPCRRVSELVVDEASYGDGFFDQYRNQLKQTMRGQDAPQCIVDCVEAATQMTFIEGLVLERKLFMDCKAKPQSAALRHVFFAQTKARNGAKQYQAKLSGNEVLAPFNRVGIIGAGTMGTGIAMCFANAGLQVTLVEINQVVLDKGMAMIAKRYQSSHAKGKLSQAQMQQRLQAITGTMDMQDLSQVDLVIEAVVENLAVKQQVFKAMDAICAEHTIFATNTSYLDIEAMADAVTRPQKLVGMHFFSPANIMPLLEVVKADRTNDATLAAVMSVAKVINKTAVVSGVCYGFIGNRMYRKYLREANLCLIEGASIEQIDQAMVDFGMAMGPFSVADLAGLDIGFKARQSLSLKARGPSKNFRVADKLVEKGRLGQKTGAGFYQYDADTRKRQLDPQVMTWVAEAAQSEGIEREAMSDEQIVLRLTHAVINEGCKILEEGIAQSASDIDLVFNFGYGFPAYRGGPMFYAEELGLVQVYANIDQLCKTHGSANWQPSTLLQQLVDGSLSFAKLPFAK
jgi:3-hydroxyacyl-CoA dehydrogenase